MNNKEKLEIFFSKSKLMEDSFFEIEDILKSAFKEGNKEILNYYENLISSISLSDYFNRFDDFINYVKEWTSSSYKESLYFEQEIKRKLDSEMIKSTKGNESEYYNIFLGGDSLTELVDIEYPTDTCPMIDLAKERVEERMKDLESEIQEKEKDKEEWQDLDEENKVLIIQSDIEDLESDMSSLENDLDLAENLRKICENIRAFMVEVSSDMKASITVYSVFLEYDYIILDVPIYSSYEIDHLSTKLAKMNDNLNFFDDSYFSDSVENKDLLYERCEALISKVAELHDTSSELFQGHGRERYNISEFIEMIKKYVK